MPKTLNELLPEQLRATIPALLPFGLQAAAADPVWDSFEHWRRKDPYFRPSDVLAKNPPGLAYPPPADPPPPPDSQPPGPQPLPEPWLTFRLTGCPDPKKATSLPNVPGFELSVLASVTIWGSLDESTSESVVCLCTVAGKTFARHLLEPGEAGPEVAIHLDVPVSKDNQGSLYFGWPAGFPGGIKLPPVRPGPLPHAVTGATLRLDLTVDAKGTIATGGERWLGLAWEEANLPALLAAALPDLVRTPAAPKKTAVAARILPADKTKLKELRLEWPLAATPLAFDLPGMAAAAPPNLPAATDVLSLVLGPDRRTLVMTVGGGATALRFESSLAWGRDGRREILGDPTASGAFARIELACTARSSVAVVDARPPNAGPPQFFRPLSAALEPLALDPTPTPLPDGNGAGLFALADPQSHTFCRIGPDLPTGWTGLLLLKTGPYRFPFLEIPEEKAEPAANRFKQWLRVQPAADAGAWSPWGAVDDRSGWLRVGLPPAHPLEALPFDAELQFGEIKFQGSAAWGLDWTTLTLSVDHASGIALTAPAPQLSDKLVSHLGLGWRLKGAGSNGRYEYFRVVTENGHYQVQAPPDAAFELEYAGISADPIVLAVRQFLLTPAGLSLTAEVADAPVRLNGIDTDFRFGGSRLEVVDNVIQDFTLGGSGPLPPDLVGEAMVDVALQFKQEAGALTLVAAAAELQGENQLECKGTRFQYEVDTIGLKFVTDEATYLYFTLTGAARYVLVPGDDPEGPLALLPRLTLDLVEAPLCGDSTVLEKHVKFLTELPTPLKFSLMGVFGFELRGIGFLPNARAFGGQPAMQLSGQVFFGKGDEEEEANDGAGEDEKPGEEQAGELPATKPGEKPAAKPTETPAAKAGEKPAAKPGESTAAKPGATPAAGKKAEDDSKGGDVISLKIDFHSLFIGLPGPGGFAPRLYMEELEVCLKVGEAFELNGAVRFYDDDTKQGFAGKGMLDIAGLPQLAAAIGFVRVREDELAEWKRAWFIYIEVRKISFPIPVVKFYLREVGLGFGYRYTIASIKAADEENDIKKLRAALVKLSKTQAELAEIDAWEVDLEKAGEDPRWTIVLRAMISQNSGSKVPILYDEKAEATLVNLFLLDAMIAFRSDLTFYMAVRGWLNTNYHEFVKGKEADAVRTSPLISGFALLSARRKMFLLAASTQEGAYIGDHPKLPDFVKDAIKAVRVSAMLLVQPGLMHFELGWPNMLSWQLTYGPLVLECRGGFIFRITNDGIVLGISFESRGRLEFKAEASAGIVGVFVEAYVQVGFAARLIAMLPFADPGGARAYASLGLELRIRLSFGFWIDLWIVRLTFRFSIDVGFTAGLELGLEVAPAQVGLRGQGTLWIAIMGHRLQVNARIGSKEDVVDRAFLQTQSVLKLGLDATDPEEGDEDGAAERGPFEAVARGMELPAFHQPDYTAFVLRAEATGDGEHRWGYLVLLPRGEHWIAAPGEPARIVMEQGFLPPPPAAPDGADFKVQFPADEPAELMHWDPLEQQWRPVTPGSDGWYGWRSRWDAPAFPAEAVSDAGAASNPPPTLKDYLAHTFVRDASGPLGDPDVSLFDTEQDALEDGRVHNPSDNAFESAVRGAAEQFVGSPYFRLDPSNPYDKSLQAAFRPDTSVYNRSGNLAVDSEGQPAARDGDADAAEAAENEGIFQARSMIVNDLVSGLRAYGDEVAGADGGGSASLPPAPTPGSAAGLPFNLGLVFAFRGTNGRLPGWIEAPVEDEAALPHIRQRGTPRDADLGAAATKVEAFNTAADDFRRRSPEFTRVQHYTSTNTVAITWDLAWGPAAGPRDDPNHHLAHYEVRRRALNSHEREVVYTVKPAEALYRESFGADGVLHHLRPRFNVVDHWSHETPDEQAAIPADGYSYLYTITPVDLSGSRGRPLTLVATRYANRPPFVPAAAQLCLTYTREDVLARIFDSAGAIPAAGDAATHPPVVEPSSIELRGWDDATDGQRPARTLAIPGRYYLLFRREETLPAGSYGLDAATAVERISTRPVSQARSLPTDIRVDVTGIQDKPDALKRALQQQGILPSTAGGWRPEAWLVYIQTESINGVRSPLVPVQLIMRVSGAGGSDERLLPMLEWLAQPLRFEWLPPEDEAASVGMARVPMPGQSGRLTGDLTSIQYREHPARMPRYPHQMEPGAERPARLPGKPQRGLSHLPARRGRILGRGPR